MAGAPPDEAGTEVVHAAELLILRGKEEGRLPPDDILRAFPIVEAEPDQLELVFNAFREMGIEVSDGDLEVNVTSSNRSPV